jgi:TPR repeat protein
MQDNRPVPPRDGDEQPGDAGGGAQPKNKAARVDDTRVLTVKALVALLQGDMGEDCFLPYLTNDLRTLATLTMMSKGMYATVKKVRRLKYALRDQEMFEGKNHFSFLGNNILALDVSQKKEHAGRLTQPAAGMLVVRCPNVKTFVARNCPLVSVMLPLMAWKWRDLRVLDVRNSGALLLHPHQSITDVHIAALFNNCKTLECLQVSNAPGLTDKGMENIAGPQLRELCVQITNNLFRVPESFDVLSDKKKFPKLTSVNVGYNGHINSLYLRAFAGNIGSRLEHLVIRGCSYTNEDVEAMLESCPNVKNLVHERGNYARKLFLADKFKKAMVQLLIVVTECCRPTRRSGRNRLYRWRAKLAQARYLMARMHKDGLGCSADPARAFELFGFAAASCKHRNACFEIGRCYEMGVGTTEDVTLARWWFKVAADANHKGAQLKVGLMYRTGTGCAVSQKEAVEWLRLAVTVDDWDDDGTTDLSVAMYELARAHLNAGTLGHPDWKGVGNRGKARFLLLGAAKNGHTDAMFELASMYATVPHAQLTLERQSVDNPPWRQDEAEDGPPGTVTAGFQPLVLAFEWFKHAAGKGDARAQYALAKCYREGMGVSHLENWGVLAFMQLMKAADQGHLLAQVELAGFYENGTGTSTNMEQMFKWLKKAADQGHTAAGFKVAKCYEMGVGTTKDAAKAFEWFEVGANRGHVPSLYNLALCCEEGRGAPADPGRALGLYSGAADLGDVVSMYAVGVCYEVGKGCSPDGQTALSWFKQAAALGDVESMYAVGVCYARGGWRLSPDLQSAHFWFRKARDHGRAGADAMMARCGKWHQRYVRRHKSGRARGPRAGADKDEDEDEDEDGARLSVTC